MTGTKGSNTTTPPTSNGFRLGGSILVIEFYADANDVKPQQGDHLVIPQLDGPGAFVLVDIPDPERDALVERFRTSDNPKEFTQEELDRIFWPGGKPPGK